MPIVPHGSRMLIYRQTFLLTLKTSVRTRLWPVSPSGLLHQSYPQGPFFHTSVNRMIAIVRLMPNDVMLIVAAANIDQQTKAIPAITFPPIVCLCPFQHVASKRMPTTVITMPYTHWSANRSGLNWTPEKIGNLGTPTQSVKIAAALRTSLPHGGLNSFFSFSICGPPTARTLLS